MAGKRDGRWAALLSRCWRPSKCCSPARQTLRATLGDGKQDRESITFQRLGTSRLFAQRADVIPVPRHSALDAFPKIDF